MRGRADVLRDLGLPADAADDHPDLEGYRAWASERGRSPSDAVTLKELAELVGTTDRTIRRWIADGSLTTWIVTEGKRRSHRVRLSHGYAVARGRRETVERAATSPVEDMAAKIEALTREVRDLREELHDSRAQLAQMQEAVLRALPAPRRRWWPFGRD